MSSFNPSLKKLRTIGIIMILMMLCIGSVAAARVASQKPVQNGIQILSLAQSNGGLVTTPMTTATALAQSLVGPGVAISNVQFTGVNCAGTFTGGGTLPSDIIGFEDGVILSSGAIANVIGPNEEDDISADNGQPGDVDLDTLIPGGSTLDACVLTFDFVPQTDVLTFDYVFTSDEYNEYVNSEYNDVFGFFVNGQNVALIPGTTTPVAINNVNGGGPTFGDNPSNSAYYRNNDLDDGGPFINTEMDGLTTVFSATANVIPGQTNTMKMAIADVSDRVLDSNVFIKGSSLVSTDLLLTPTAATNLVGSIHTVTATFTPPAGVAASGKPVNFEITAGPNAGMAGGSLTDANGVATWSYTSTVAGKDTIHAFIILSMDPLSSVSSNLAYKTWVTGGNNIPEFPSMFLPATMIIGFLGAVLLIQRTREH